MKKLVKPKSRNVLLQSYPIEDRVEGWFFRIKEVSNNVFRVEGTDIYGRLVLHSGTNPDQLLEQCITDAEAIKRRLEEAQ